MIMVFYPFHLRKIIIMDSAASENLIVSIENADDSNVISVIDSLLDKNADINYITKSGKFPLLVAVQLQNENIVRHLLNKGAKVDQKSIRKITPLSLASEMGNCEIVQELIKREANVDHKISDGRTPLIPACENGNDEVVKELIENGANIAHALSSGLTALMFASKNGHDKTVHVLLSCNNASTTVNLCTTDGELNAISFAVKNNHSKIVELLIPHVANVNFRYSYPNRFTLLMQASLNGQPKIVETLIKHGACVHLRTLSTKYVKYHDADHQLESESTALMIAAVKGYTETAQILLENEADIDSRNRAGESSLIIATKCGHAEFVKLLLLHNANVNFKEKSGKTALSIASNEGYINIIQLLLDNNDEKSHKEETIGRGKELKNRKRIRCGVIRDQANYDAICESTTAPHHSESSLQSALSNAIYKQNLEIVQLLLKHKAKIRYQDLISACEKGNEAIVELLIQQGINIDLIVAHSLMTNSVPYHML